MALVSLGLDNFESLILNDYAEDGYHPMTLDEIKEHELFDDILKILKVVKPDFNQLNTFCIKIEHGCPSAVYGFSLIQKDGKAVLQFGANGQENPQNEVEVTVETLKDTDDEETTVIKAGKAKIVYDRLDRTKGDSKPVFLLKFGKASLPIFVKLASEEINTSHFDELKNTEELINLLGTIGTTGVKLTDVVRPYVKEGCKGILPRPLMIEVTSWEIQPPHPEYGTSIIFNVVGLQTALRADGTTVRNPGAIFVNSNQVSAQLIQKPAFAQQVLLYIHYQGSLNLVITAVNVKEPERNMPTNILKCIKPLNSAMLAALNMALQLAKEGVPFEEILQQVPLPSQTAIAASDIFPTFPIPNGTDKQLVTVGATATTILEFENLDTSAIAF